MKIEMLNIKDLIMYENNPRNNDNAVDKVAESINEFGFKVPMVIDKNNVIVCGHTRYKACLKLGIDEVPCVIADDLTDEQIKAFRLVDNKVGELAGWDFDQLDEELKDVMNIDMEQFGFDVDDAEYGQEFCFEDLERQDDKQGNVIVTINIPLIANWNLVEDEIKRIADQIDASLAVKLQ